MTTNARTLTAETLGEPIDLGCKDEIVLVQTFDLFRLQDHRNVAPPKPDIWMMTFGLCEASDLLHKRQRFAKIAKRNE